MAQFEPTSNGGESSTSVSIASFLHVNAFANIFTDFVSNPGRPADRMRQVSKLFIRGIVLSLPMQRAKFIEILCTASILYLESHAGSSSSRGRGMSQLWYCAVDALKFIFDSNRKFVCRTLQNMQGKLQVCQSFTTGNYKSLART